MRKLLSANFSRLFRSKVYWIGMLFMFGFAAFAVCSRYNQTIRYPEFAYPTADGLWFVGGMYIAVVLAVFISLWGGTDYNDGAIRNKLTVGRTRGQVYLSNWITCVTASIMMQVIYIIVIAGLGVLILGPFETPAKVLLLSSLAGMVTVVAMASLFLMIAMLIHNKAISAVVSMVVSLVVILSAITVLSKLSAPEYYENNYQMTVDGQIVKGEPELNPNYLRGTKREIYQFFLDASPGGQMLQYGAGDDCPENIEMFPTYSLLFAAVTTGVGFFFFRRKDLK